MNTLYAQTITKDYVKGRVDQLKDQFQERFDLVDNKLLQYDGRFIEIDKRFDFVDEKIDNLKEAIEFSFNHLNGKVEENTKDIKEIKVMIRDLDQKFTPLLGLLTLIQK